MFRSPFPTDYSGTIFQDSLGFDAHLSGLMSGFLNTWFFLASFIPWFLIDKVGRRPLLLSMVSLMAGVMAVQAALVYQTQQETSIARKCLTFSDHNLRLTLFRLCWYRRRCHAVHLPRCLHRRFPSHRLGLPIRDPSPSSPPERFFNLHRYQLDHELLDRLHYSPCHQKHQVENLHHLRCAQRHLGTHHGKILSLKPKAIHLANTYI